MYDVIVIGGGASGLMAAGRAAERGKMVLIIEKNKTLGVKLKITGGGRCNITNAEEDKHILLSNYGKANKFLYSPFSQFGVKETFEFFESRGLPLVIEDRKRAFPITMKASDVYNVLYKYALKGKVEIITGVTVREITSEGDKIKKIITSAGEYSAKSYILATGGLSHPETGSTGDGFRWLKELGHKIENPTPTIVPISVSDGWIKKMSGSTAVNAKLTFYSQTRKKFSIKGDILFTHFGLSGPLILNNSHKVASLLQEGAVLGSFDFFPDLDIGSLDKKITTAFDKNKNKTLKNVYKEITPEGLGVHLFSEIKDIDQNKKIHDLTKEDRRKIVDFLKGTETHVTGLMGFDRAVIADGGVNLKEIDTKTMRSLVCINLFITGDLLNIQRPSGGYSLQLCWTTGFVAGNNT